MTLNAIYELIHEDLSKVEDCLRAVTNVDFLPLSNLLEHSLKSGGKRIRPALALLAGRFYEYNLARLVPLATTLELSHIATLIHDDSIDHSPVRHSRPTINSLWGEEKAILLGDYLFAKAGETIVATGNLRVTKLHAQAIMNISSGELTQAFNAFNLEQTRQDYLYRISRKTASLFSFATESGAILSQAPQRSIKALKEYGHNIGVAFQIVDDILDFIGTEEELGKPIGSDLAQGTLTLPAMMVLERYPGDNPIKRLFQGDDLPQNIKAAMEIIRNSSIVPECYELASFYSSKACQNLELLPDTPARRPLAELADYIVNRRK